MLGSLIGDPARANILVALMSGKALTATELASEAGVTPQTASSHLKKLESANLIKQVKQGRHRYYSIADDEVAHVIETVSSLAAKRGHLRTRTGPKDPALRKARICYDHLAGEMGVQMYDSLVENDYLQYVKGDITLSETGDAFITRLGIHLPPLYKARRPLCRQCLDWSARRSHLAGSLGTALLNHFIDVRWAKREEGSRIISFSAKGEQEFNQLFPELK